ncbi:hypothetical protein N431DRAFT_20612 [Stipitochalara longipes BDJ]|nr:hypothetical protein N431DRAFT_20612 [Stipitochalara longipes BDJ]
MFLIVCSHVTCASAARDSPFPNLEPSANRGPWLLYVGLLSGHIEERADRCVLVDLRECHALDVLPRILTVLKSPEGSVANHCQIQAGLASTAK